MNIKQAKNQIANTLRAYLMKDKLGNYLIPQIRQRPVLLMGPPGIGKTQIMEQIASEEGVGLVAYTITHHTRQSAVGLPFIEKRVYGGKEYSVTDYTMSEIIGSVYELMEKTGIREGILFLDEINCVSETLAPMMLQFLQCKTFGNEKLPEGWLVVAAGNPPEYNRSVRDFDVVTLDRVKRMNIEEDFAVWKEYARKKGLHGAVVSYLDIKKDNFYKVENTADGIEFATARGWEDLSEIIFAYEQLGIPVDSTVTVQYIQLPKVARDFANYLTLYYKYQKNYHVDAILNGEWPKVTETEFREAPFDEKISVMGLLLSRLSEASALVRHQDELSDKLYTDMLDLKERIKSEAVSEILESMIQKRRAELKKAANAGHGNKEVRDLIQKEINALEKYRETVVRIEPLDPQDAFDIIKELFGEEPQLREELAGKAGKEFDNAFRFLESSVGQGQELVMFVTEITSGYDTSWYVENFGCDAYFRHNSELLFDNTRRKIIEEIVSAKE